MSVPVLAAVTSGSGDFVVGILLGTCLGYLIGPALRSWQAHREWTEASREARLADRFLTSLEADSDLHAIEDPGEADRVADTNGHAERPIWRTSH